MNDTLLHALSFFLSLPPALPPATLKFRVFHGHPSWCNWIGLSRCRTSASDVFSSQTFTAISSTWPHALTLECGFAPGTRRGLTELSRMHTADGLRLFVVCKVSEFLIHILYITTKRCVCGVRSTCLFAFTLHRERFYPGMQNVYSNGTCSTVEQCEINADKI